MALAEKLLSVCSLRSIDKTFKTRELSSLPSLNEWMAQSADMSELEKQILLRYQKGLAFNVHDWNEYELDTHFIGPVFSLADFSSPYFNHFGQRDIEATVDDVLLYGRVDGMIASGRREPELPYFAFQEYKRNLDPNGDPAGQCLGAMLVGQTLGSDPTLPVYGCYVVGRDWYFLTLESRNYAITKGHNALDTDELFDIFRLLRALRQFVAQRVATQLNEPLVLYGQPY